MRDVLRMPDGNRLCVRSAHPLKLHDLPWGGKEFDAFIAILDSRLVESLDLAATIRELVTLNNDWIETLGPGAEIVHDMVDEASVAVGRQKAVGDGHPMTAWWEEIVSVEGMAEYIRDGGHGYAYYKLLLPLGGSTAVQELRSVLGNAQTGGGGV